MFQYFTVTCYRGFDDTTGAFYAVYREVFERLAAEDLEFMDSDDEDTSIPSFGRADSDYEAVVGPFYAYWQSYCTKKSYAWLCPHNVTEIRDRRILRHVEKDTKKLAQKARKERNDEVRALVAFVKKRDRRVLEYRRLLEDRAEQNRIKQQEKRLEQIRRNRAEVEAEMQRQKAGGVTAFSGDYEAQLRQMEAAYPDDDSDEKDDDDDDELEDDVEGVAADLASGVTIEDDIEQYIDQLYCVACNKSFKNDSSFQNHQSSKKHKDNIEKLRLEMLDEEDAHNKAANASDSSDNEDAIVQPVKTKQSKKSKRKAQKLITALPISDDADDDHNENDGTEPALLTADPPGNAINDEDNNDADEPQVSQKTKKSRRRAKNALAAEAPSKPQTPRTTHVKPTLVSSSDSDDDWAKSKAARKGNNTTSAKAARKAKNRTLVGIDETADIDHTCVTCAAVFDSKNKLFAHLKATNHGVYIEGKGVTASRAAAAAAAAAEPARQKGRKK